MAESKTTRALARDAPTDESLAKKPAEGEQTGPQSVGGIGFSIGGSIAGFSKPAPGTFATYRRMRANPTLALARVVESAPIKTVDWGFEAPDDAPNGALDFVRETIKPLLASLVKEAIRSFDYGFSAFEKVWEIRRVDGTARLTYRKLKPLLVDITQPRVDKEDGGFAGIKNRGVELDAVQSFWFTYDGEPGNEWFGRSKNENIRKAWSAWEDLFKRAGQYASRAAGPTPLWQYPEGKSKDRNGNDISNFELAEQLMVRAQSGLGIIAPNTLAKWASTLAEKGISDPSKFQAWIFDFIEPGKLYGADFVKLLTHTERLLTRGRLVPERAVLEGEHGTKAEATAHGDIVLMIADEFLRDLATCINRFLIDPLLVVNWGIEAKGTVKARPAPLIDEQKMLIREMVTKVLTATGNVPLLQTLVDLEASVEQLGLPKPPEDAEPILPDDPPDDPDDPLTLAVLGAQLGLERRVKALAG